MGVLVTGATGALGSRLVPRLAARGFHPMVGTRVPDGPDDRAYDLAEPPSLAGVSAVVHLASDPRRPDLDVAAMRRLVEAADRDGVDHIVFISIVGIDDHPYPYYRAKLAQERILAAGGVPWTILRSTQFHHFVPHLGLLFPGGIPAGYRAQPVDADAVAERLADIVEAGPSGRVPDIGGPQVIDVAAAVRAAAERAGRLAPEVVPPADEVARAFASGVGLLGPGGRVVGPSWDEYLAAGAA